MIDQIPEAERKTVMEAVESLRGRGVESVIVIPYFLTLGLHLQRDLPRLIREIESAHPGLSIEVTPPLDGHPAMIDALLDRALETWKQN